VLSENVARPGQEGSALIVGIGLNINMPSEDAARIDKPATSVFIESGRDCPVEDALSALTPYLAKWLARWEAGGFAALREEYCARAWRLGQSVTVGDGDNTVSGVLRGFGESGEILLELPCGTQQTCWSGDFAY
jgi:BirA family biotin operon repressor/biotin-[acetyl-CoA-carboxylase] ligase